MTKSPVYAIGQVSSKFKSIQKNSVCPQFPQWVIKIMKRLIYLIFVNILIVGCAGGVNYKAAGDSKLQISSEPSGVDIEVIELKQQEQLPYDQSSMPSPSYQGISPLEISLDMIAMKNRAIRGYLIRFKKNGYLPEARIVDIHTSMVKVDSGRETTSKALTPAAAVVPVLAVPAIYLGGAKHYADLSMSTNNVHVILEPANSLTNTGSKEICRCIEHYISIAQPINDNNIKKTSFVKLIPSLWWVRWKGEPHNLTCKILDDEMKKGKRITFAKGILKLPSGMYSFTEKSFIEHGIDGKIKSYDIYAYPEN